MLFFFLGSKTPDSLRNQLKRAVTQRNKANLEKAIHDAEAAGYPELAYDLQKARETLEKLGGGRGGEITIIYSILIYVLF